MCAFGEACSWPVQSFVGKFKDEFVPPAAAADEARRAAGQPAAPYFDQRFEAHVANTECGSQPTQPSRRRSP